MAENEIDNTTGTELDILQNIERSYFRQRGTDIRRNTKKSLDWFRKTVTKNYSKVRTARMYRDRDLQKASMTIGKMYFYEYDAKHKDTLPVWDRYPLIIPFNSYTASDGMQIVLGINTHFLPPRLRLAAFRAMLKFRNEKRFRRTTKMKFQWQQLMGIAESDYFKHAVRAYRMDHVRSTFVEIPAQSWELVLFLPLQRFMKGGKSKAWKGI